MSDHALLACVEAAFDALRAKLAGRAAANDKSANLHSALGDRTVSEHCAARASAYWIAADDVRRALDDLLVELSRLLVELSRKADDNEAARERSKEGAMKPRKKSELTQAVRIDSLVEDVAARITQLRTATTAEDLMHLVDDADDGSVSVGQLRAAQSVAEHAMRLVRAIAAYEKKEAR